MGSRPAANPLCPLWSPPIHLSIVYRGIFPGLRGAEYSLPTNLKVGCLHPVALDGNPEPDIYKYILVLNVY
jgi:hypothetical protein